MKKIQYNGHTLVLFASIEELPISRFNAFNRYLLIDAGVGGDLAAVDRHLSAVLRFLSKEDRKSAEREVMNLRQNIAFALQNVSPEMMAFVPLIQSIDGKPVEDLTIEGVQAVLEDLAEKRFRVGDLFSWVREAKKKIDEELLLFFPEASDTPEIANYYHTLKQRTLAILRFLQTGKGEAQVEELDEHLFSLYTPKVYSGREGVEAKAVKGFEQTCIIIAQEIGKDPKKMTTFEFYQALALLKEQQKAREKITKHGRTNQSKRPLPR